MVGARKPRTYKIWYAAARLTVRDSGRRAARVTWLHKKSPNDLKSLDAELKSAPGFPNQTPGRSHRLSRLRRVGESVKDSLDWHHGFAALVRSPAVLAKNSQSDEGTKIFLPAKP
jgi:hypothetical protein